jgi:hypothetical protein
MCKLVLRRDSSLLNMVEVNVRYKQQVTLNFFTIVDCCTQVLPPGARIGNYTTYFIYGDKIATQF